MPVYIHQPDALARMAAVEGSEWLAGQDRNRASAYHFPLWLEAWQLKVAAGDEKEDYPLDEYVVDRFNSAIEPAIYGNGGYHRYIVRPNGEILFSRSHAIASRIPDASAQGFSLL
jgi:hypothetical protein